MDCGNATTTDTGTSGNRQHHPDDEHADEDAVARYGLIWLEIARTDYDSLPDDIRAQIDHRIEQLLENPRQTTDGYDQATDQWTTTYGEGAGLIVYAVVQARQRVVILRLV